MNKKYFKIVYFKNNKFQKYSITDDEEEIKKIIDLKLPNIEIYKCNSKGNNYTGRRIY